MTTPTNDASETVKDANAMAWAIVEKIAAAPVLDGPLGRVTKAREAIAARQRVAALASAPAGDGYGKWHPMLLDIVNAIHGDRGEKTQAIGIDLSYQQALTAALARPRAAVGEREA